MTNEEVAFVAEALLSLCEPRREQPFYTEEAMRRKLVAAERREPIYAHLVAGRPHDSMLEEECRGIVRSARLTDPQSEVLGLRLEGFTFEEIGSRRGHTKQGAMRVFVQALKKLARACRVYPFRGLSDVYRCEVRRGSPKSRSGTMSCRAAARDKGDDYGRLSAMSNSKQPR